MVAGRVAPGSGLVRRVPVAEWRGRDVVDLVTFQVSSLIFSVTVMTAFSSPSYRL